MEIAYLPIQSPSKKLFKAGSPLRRAPFHPVFMAVESPERNGKDPVELCCSRIFRSPWATFSAVQGAQKMMVLQA